MFWRILDAIDRFTGHDRRAVRALLLIALGLVLLWAAEWGIGRILDPPSNCDADCQREADKFINDHPGFLNTPDTQKAIDKILRDIPNIIATPTPARQR